MCLSICLDGKYGIEDTNGNKICIDECPNNTCNIFHKTIILYK